MADKVKQWVEVAAGVKLTAKSKARFQDAALYTEGKPFPAAFPLYLGDREEMKAGKYEVSMERLDVRDNFLTIFPEYVAVKAPASGAGNAPGAAAPRAVS